VSALPYNIAAVLLLSLAAGALSYRVIEYPTAKLRSLRNKDGSKRNYYPELEQLSEVK
jgi:peptidoglycan/LPS O-acetylase OafA/YrhL